MGKNGHKRYFDDSMVFILYRLPCCITFYRRDDLVKEYLQMRENHKNALKKIK